MDYDLTATLYQKMKLEEAVDGDINRVAKQFPDIDKETIKEYAEEADPKTDKGSRYIDWLVKGHSNGAHGLEDAPRLKEGLTNFEKHKSKLDKKDINQYKHISEVEDAVAPHMGTLSNTQKKDPNNFAENPDHREKVYDNGKGLQVFHTKTKEASQAIYGGGHQSGGEHTSWCTAARSDNNRFDQYNKDGKNPLYQIHTPDGKVYQDEFSGDFSGGLRNAADATVKREDLVKEHPDLRNVPAFQGKDLTYSDDAHAHDALHQEIKKSGAADYDKVISHPGLDASHISALIDASGSWRGPDENHIAAVMNHPAFNSEHITKIFSNHLLTNNDTTKAIKIMNHPKFDSSAMHEVSNRQYVHEDIAREAVKHTSFGDSHIDEVMNQSSRTAMKTALFNSDKLKREHIVKAIYHLDGDTRAYGISHPLATDSEREHAFENDESRGVKVAAIRTMKDPALIEKHLNNANAKVGEKDEFLNSQAVDNPNANSSTIRSAFDNLSEYSKKVAVLHKNAPSDVIAKHLATTYDAYKIEALKAPNINSEHVASLWANKNHLVKQAALRHPKATKEILDSAMSDVGMHGSISVSKAATPEHLGKLGSSEHDFIRKNVAENKNTSKETLSNLAQDSVSEVKEAALKSLKKKK